MSTNQLFKLSGDYRTAREATVPDRAPTTSPPSNIVAISRAPRNCTYCNPEVASVGLTEKQAREKGLDIEVGKFPFVGIGRAVALELLAELMRLKQEAESRLRKAIADEHGQQGGIDHSGAPVVLFLIQGRVL